MIELGGNIVLEGFSSKDFTELIVVKKMVGQYARHVTDAKKEAEKFSVIASEADGKHTINVEIVLDGEAYTAESTQGNLYMALDNALKGATGKIV